MPHDELRNEVSLRPVAIQNHEERLLGAAVVWVCHAAAILIDFLLHSHSKPAVEIVFVVVQIAIKIFFFLFLYGRLYVCMYVRMVISALT